MNDMQHRRMELLGEIKRKSRRTNHFVKDKDQAANLVSAARVLKFTHSGAF